MAKTVVGLMDTPQEAESVVRELTSDCQCSRSDIGLMAKGPQNEVTGGAGTTGESGGDISSGALKGAGTGAAIGGVLGLVAGVASLSIPGLGPFIAAGPIASALAGVGIGAAAGGVIGALTKLGVPEEEAHYYAEGVRRGGTLITVHAASDDIADCAAQVMRRHGASDIEQRAAEWKQQGWSGVLEGGAREDQEVLPVVEEEMVVAKRPVSRGGVRVYSQVTETPVEQQVELREERVQVERRPVDRPIEASDDAFQERTIEVREMSEEPVVAKRSHVTEEVRVGKQTTQRQETVRDTVRKTDVQIEDSADDAMESSDAPRVSGYQGPERRLNPGRYGGVERRMTQR